MNNLVFLYGTGEHRFEEQVGIALTLMWKVPGRKELTLDQLVNRLETPIRLEQIYFVYNKYNRPIAFFTWAMLARDVELKIVREREPRLHESEWNEGNSLWIMDMVAPFGGVAQIVGKMKREIFKGNDRAYSFRDKAGRRIIRIWKCPNRIAS